jgi:hypothetical protein
MTGPSCRSVLPLLGMLACCGCTTIGDRATGSPGQAVAGSDEGASLEHAERRLKPTVVSSFSQGDGLALGAMRVSTAAMLPIQPPERMLLIRPSLGLQLLDTPQATPSRLYSASVNMMWFERLRDDLALTVAANPSVGGDEHEFGRRLRVFAMGAVGWDWIPDQLKLTAGAAWLGRRDIGVVPAAGLEWTPNDDWNVSLILPRPKISRRVAGFDSSEVWIYGAGAIGGGTFDIRRPGGIVDELSIRELQATLGVELTDDQLGRGFCEVGFGFARELRFERGPEEFEFGPGFLLRIGLTR